MNDDLISRAGLKKTAKRIESMPWSDEEGNRIEFKWTSEELEALIDKAPSAEPRWIPVTERLPEESGYYLITSNSDYVYDVEIRFFFFQHERRKKWKKGFGDVIAWQRLPEPYKGGDDE